MNLSQFQKAVGHGRGSDAGPGQAGDHGRESVAPVEAVFELGEVSWHVFGAGLGIDHAQHDVVARQTLGLIDAGASADALPERL